MPSSLPQNNYNSATWLALYTRIAHRYDFQIGLFARLAGGLGSFYRRCGRLLQLRPGAKVLDMCCGTGNLPLALEREVAPGGEICGIDFCPTMIEVASGKAAQSHRVSFSVQDATATNFEAESFDGVTVIAALHEMPREMRLAVLRECNRVLRPGGRLLVGEHARSRNVFARRFNEAVFRLISRPEERVTLADMLDHGIETEMGASGFSIEEQASLALGGFQLILGKKPQSQCLKGPAQISLPTMSSARGWVGLY
jgi:ubiquinone/menaquinone biosynthesis C-methylase UbiE